jgi:hypothetical protein
MYTEFCEGNLLERDSLGNGETAGDNMKMGHRDMGSKGWGGVEIRILLTIESVVYDMCLYGYLGL